MGLGCGYCIYSTVCWWGVCIYMEEIGGGASRSLYSELTINIMNISKGGLIPFKAQ